MLGVGMGVTGPCTLGVGTGPWVSGPCMPGVGIGMGVTGTCMLGVAKGVAGIVDTSGIDWVVFKYSVIEFNFLFKGTIFFKNIFHLVFQIHHCLF